MTTRSPRSTPQTPPKRALEEGGDTTEDGGVDLRASQSDVPTAVQDNPLTALPARAQRLATLPMGNPLDGKIGVEPSAMRHVPLLVAEPSDEETAKLEIPAAVRAAARGDASVFELARGRPPSAPRVPVSIEPQKSGADTTSPWGVTAVEAPARNTDAKIAEREEPPAPRAAPALPARAAAETTALETNAPLLVVNVTGIVVALILSVALVAGAGLIAGALLLSRSHVVVPRQVLESQLGPASATTSELAAHPPSAPSIGASSAPSTASAKASETSSTNDDALPADPFVAETGPRPSKTAVDRMVERIGPALEECAKGLPKAFYLVHLDFDGPTGTATGVDSPNKPLKGTLRGACVLRVGLSARVPPFAGTTWSYDLKFAPK